MVSFESGVKRVGAMDDDSRDDGRDEQAWVDSMDWEECEEERLGWGWWNEAGGWFQRQNDEYRNERFVIFEEEDKHGRVILMTYEERMLLVVHGDQLTDSQT